MTGRRTPVILGLVALLLAFLSGYAVFTYLEQLTTLATVPVPRQSIPAGALISAALLQEREVPRSLLKEPIYTAAAELVGTRGANPTPAGAGNLSVARLSGARLSAGGRAHLECALHPD